MRIATAASYSEATEESERLLGSRTCERAEVSVGVPATASLPPAEQAQKQEDLDEKLAHRNMLVIPAASQQAISTSAGASGAIPRPSGHARTSSLDSLKSNTSSSRGSGPSSAGAAPKGEVGLCRICLEEDSLSNLEQPCACSGTQKYAHHQCVQSWVNEKRHLRCEICDQEYRGDFSVPPPDEASNRSPQPVFIRVGENPNRPALDFLDESDHYYQRNPLASWCFTFVIFVMFLVVLHHTMVVADGMDSSSSSSGDESDDYATSLTLFLFWVGTKAFLIGIPLYTVMRIAARQARREQYEAMLRSGAFETQPRRYVWRMQLRDQERRHGNLPV